MFHFEIFLRYNCCFIWRELWCRVSEELTGGHFLLQTLFWLHLWCKVGLLVLLICFSNKLIKLILLLLTCWALFPCIFFNFFRTWFWINRRLIVWIIILILNIKKLLFLVFNLPVLCKNSFLYWLSMHEFFLFKVAYESQQFLKEFYCHLLVICCVHVTSSFNLTINNEHGLFVILISVNAIDYFFLTSSYSHKRRKTYTVNALVCNENFVFLVLIRWFAAKTMSNKKVVSFSVQ